MMDERNLHPMSDLPSDLAGTDAALRAWYRRESGALGAPSALAARVADIPEQVATPRRWLGEWPSARLRLILVASLLLLALTIGAVAVGSGLIRLPWERRQSVGPGSSVAAYVRESLDEGNCVESRWPAWDWDWGACGVLVLSATDGTQLAVFPTEPDTTAQFVDVAWSPSGDRLAFLGATDQGLALYAVRADGSDLRVVYRLSPEPTGSVGWEVDWSQNGTTLLLTRFGDAQAEGWMAIDAESGIAIVADEQVATEVAVSPSGSWIAYSLDNGLWIVGRDGSEPQLLVSGEAAEDPFRGLQWSPDGAWLLYQDSGASSIVRPDGSDRHTLTGWARALWLSDSNTVVFEGLDATVIKNVDGEIVTTLSPAAVGALLGRTTEGDLVGLVHSAFIEGSYVVLTSTDDFTSRVIGELPPTEENWDWSAEQDAIYDSAVWETGAVRCQRIFYLSTATLATDCTDDLGGVPSDTVLWGGRGGGS